MIKILDRYADHAYALLRIVAGALFLFHGAQKLFGVFGAAQPAFGSQLWFAGIIEFFGGAAIMLGLGTRIAAFVASGEMAVAYFQVHWRLQMDPAHVFPILNKGELAVLYAFLFLYIALKGGGKWSLTKKI
jgi:putative oxidoreductase